MKARIVISLCVIMLLVVPAWAQPGRGDDAAAAGKYVGVIVGTNVYVRAGPGQTSYQCIKLSAPTQVTVVGKIPGWLKILPPPECFSVVNKEYVKADETGNAGTIAGDNVFARAGGPLRASNFTIIQVRLSGGDKVQILGQVEGYYKIAPPPGAVLYISDQYVKPLTGGEPGEPAAVVRVPGSTTRPARPATATEPAVGIEAPPALPVPEAPDQSAIASFNAAEKDLRAEFAKPAAQQDLRGLLQKYLAINTAGSESLTRYVPLRIKLLQDIIADQEAHKQVDALVHNARQRQDQYDEELNKIPPIEATAKVDLRFTAQGVLMPSELFPGTGALPKRYLLRDPQTLQINAYVQCTSGVVDLPKYESKYVGIKGKTVFDRQLTLDVVEAEEVVVLPGGKVAMPMPPQPVVKPMPKSEPRITPIPLPEKSTTRLPATRVPPPEAAPATPAAPAPKPAAAPARPADRDIPEIDLEGPGLLPVPKPDKPAATTQPAPAEAKEPAPAPASQPAPPAATEPAASDPAATQPAKPLPPTGLPMAEPKSGTGADPVNEKEFK